MLEHTMIKVDLAFKDYPNVKQNTISPMINALKCSKFLKYKISKIPYLREVILIIKKMLSICELNIPLNGFF